ncbi:HK97 family phage prohead protease [Paenibacillus lutimineralis]|uniref:Prohead serine protease domain-containing protein n=1 Tax=Paenibacillus lutimineralis TaxID=2707005 RepID=A0A3S9UW67_9BACL|nr:HK97 family phage prohead protease [Paenibacillus lutimineralis]AZS14572.1 hypothetical protein EI981_08985 [Paenibacillus lutimineralis]
MKKIQKAIYGMAMPFNDCYIDVNSDDSFTAQKTNRESVRFDKLVGMTLFHDFTKTFGSTNDNLFIQVTDTGIYFKLIPNTPFGWSVYKKVKRAALRHCSLSFTNIKKERNVVQEKNLTESFRSLGLSDSIVIEDYRKIRVYEICLTNGPANKLTFCTTDAKDPRLADLNWDNIEPLPPLLIQCGDKHEVRIADEIEILAKDVEEYRKQFQEVYGK